MCVQAVIAVATSVISFAAAQADYNARAEQWRQNYTNSLAAGRDEQQQLSLRMMQEQDAHAQKQHLTTIEGAQVSAEAEVSAAASGVSGLSLDNILLGIGRDVAMKQEADKTNYQNTVAQLTKENEATNTRIENRINSVQRPVAPNPLGYALQGIGGALKAS
jgi:hypothetical protein